MRWNLFAPFAVLLILASHTMSQAQERPEIAGRWMCDRLCAIWDTGASITIDGKEAICQDERGDVSRGRLLTNRSVRCFGIVGQLTDDSNAIEWTNGHIWRRDRRIAF
jgi:hypothetical protein